MLPGLYSGNGMGGDPDLFITNFGEYAVGAQPADWTNRWTTTGFTALIQPASGSLRGQVLRWTKTAVSRQALSWDRVPLVTDVETLVRFRSTEAAAAQEAFIALLSRGAGGATGSTTGYVNAFKWFTNGTFHYQIQQKYVAGTGSNLAASGVDGNAPNFAVGQWIWGRFRANGTSMQSKLWHDGYAEPAAWQLTQSDSAIATAGWVGLFNDSTNPDVEIDYFGAALNGKTVPMLV